MKFYSVPVAPTTLNVRILFAERDKSLKNPFSQSENTHIIQKRRSSIVFSYLELLSVITAELKEEKCDISPFATHHETYIPICKPL